MNCKIHQINVARGISRLHAILNADSSSDIILVQEPPFYQVGSQRSLLSIDGNAVYGTVAHAAWNCFLPTTNPSPVLPPRVCIYARRASHFMFTPLYNISRHTDLCFLRVEGQTDQASPPFLIINAYIGAPSEPNHALPTLSSLILPPLPLLLAGDFNRYHEMWSIPPFRPSAHLQPFIDFLALYSLTLLNSHHTATRRNPIPGQRGSAIDLTFISQSFALTFLNLAWSVSFDPILSSDHGNIFTTFNYFPTPPPPLQSPQPFSINPALQSEWFLQFEKFWALSFPPTSPPPPLASAQDIDDSVAMLHDIFHRTSTAVFDAPKAKRHRHSPWWTPDLSSLLQNCRAAHTPAEKREASHLVRMR